MPSSSDAFDAARALAISDAHVAADQSIAITSSATKLFRPGDVVVDGVTGLHGKVIHVTSRTVHAQTSRQSHD